MRARLARVLALLATLSAVWACGIWLTGGFEFTAFGTLVHSHNVRRPIIVGLLAAGALVWIEGAKAVFRRFEDTGRGLSAVRLAAGLACAVFLTGVGWGTWTAGGPDPFAYLSQAALWRSGHLEVPVPLASGAPWPNAMAAFTPWGYRAAPGGAPALVPTTAAGLPMLMSIAQRIGGFTAAFLITPLAGALLVWVTFAIGRQTRSSATGLIAAWLVATSPAFLFMVMWPMTDVPAAACAALMVWLLLGSSTGRAAVAGFAGSMGLLLRPTFAMLVAGAIAWLALEVLKKRRWRLAAFIAGLLPGALTTAVLNATWYGSLFASGYGSIGDLFTPSHIGPNAMRYSRWLVTTSPLVMAGAVALFWFVSRASDPARRRAFRLLAIIVVAAWFPYLLYETFDDWWYLRFLLPAWPAMCVGAAAALDIMRTRARLAGIVVILTVLGAGITGVAVSHRRGVFTLNERRYATVARLVATATEPSAVILTVQHSGSIRFYAGRQTVRWDVLDPAWLDPALAWLSAQGRHPYLLIEDWEEPQFESKFGAANRNGRLSYAPTVAWQSVRKSGWIFLFDPLARGAAPWNPGPEFERDEPFCARPAADPWPR